MSRLLRSLLFASLALGWAAAPAAAQEDDAFDVFERLLEEARAHEEAQRRAREQEPATSPPSSTTTEPSLPPAKEQAPEKKAKGGGPVRGRPASTPPPNPFHELRRLRRTPRGLGLPGRRPLLLPDAPLPRPDRRRLGRFSRAAASDLLDRAAGAADMAPAGASAPAAVIHELLRAADEAFRRVRDAYASGDREAAKAHLKTALTTLARAKSLAGPAFRSYVFGYVTGGAVPVGNKIPTSTELGVSHVSARTAFRISLTIAKTLSAKADAELAKLQKEYLELLREKVLPEIEDRLKEDALDPRERARILELRTTIQTSPAEKAFGIKLELGKDLSRRERDEYLDPALRLTEIASLGLEELVTNESMSRQRKSATRVAKFWHKKLTDAERKKWRPCVRRAVRKFVAEEIEALKKKRATAHKSKWRTIDRDLKFLRQFE